MNLERMKIKFGEKFVPRDEFDLEADLFFKNSKAKPKVNSLWGENQNPLLISRKNYEIKNFVSKNIQLFPRKPRNIK